MFIWQKQFSPNSSEMLGNRDPEERRLFTHKITLPYLTLVNLLTQEVTQYNSHNLEVVETLLPTPKSPKNVIVRQRQTYKSIVIF